MVIPVHRSIRVLLLIFDWVSTLIYFITIAVSFSIGWINADWNSPISFLPVLAAVIFDILTITFFEIVEKSIKSSIQRKLYSKKNSTQKNVKL